MIIHTQTIQKQFEKLRYRIGPCVIVETPLNRVYLVCVYMYTYYKHAWLSIFGTPKTCVYHITSDSQIRFGYKYLSLIGESPEVVADFDVGKAEGPINAAST